jgi:hypothetical protein
MRALTYAKPVHCKEIWIYVFPEKELRGLSPNFHMLSVSDLYIPTFGPPIFLQQNRQTDLGNILIGSQKLECRNWDCIRPVPFLGIYVSNFRYRVFAVCSFVRNWFNPVQNFLFVACHLYSVSSSFYRVM